MRKIKNTNSYYKFYKEGEDYIKKEDTVQASEKLYKCAEEIIKLLAKHYKLSEYKSAKNNGRWDARLLFSAVRNLSQKSEPEIAHWWRDAWFLYVEGFHEMRLNMDEVKFIFPSIKKLVKKAQICEKM